MKILFLGDSITDMGRNRDVPDGAYNSLGFGYPNIVANKLNIISPCKHFVINRGNGGDRITDLYTRIKKDVWNVKPDVISILIGVNDVWHEIDYHNGVELDRWVNIYDILLRETKQRLPQCKIIVCEPFFLEGTATTEHFEQFVDIYKYAEQAKLLALKHNCYFIPLQAKLTQFADKYGASKVLYDGVHPANLGATVIADTWVDFFTSEIDK